MLPTMGEVFVRLATTAIEGDEAQALLNRHATDADRAEAETHTRVLRRNQTLVGRAALRRLLAEATGVDGALWRLARDATGRPFAQHPNGTVGPEISLAHSGSWSACAIASAGAIGIDIEVPNGRRDANGMATFLSDSERMAVTREGEAALLDFWTLREALAKAGGGTVLDALALDGAAVIAARGRIGAHQIGGNHWVVGQRSTRQFHIAVSWLTPRAARTAGLDLLTREFGGLT